MEMVTGVLLGPSLFGLLLPEFQSFLFPQKYSLPIDGVTHDVRHPSMQILYIIAQLGLVLYMFLVGVEFDVNLIKKRAGAAIFVSVSGVVAPLALGIAFGFFLHGQATSGTPQYFGPNVTAMNAAIFMGASMCITAFPMLARIIMESGLARTTMGTLALGAGATDDAIAWSLLAVVLAVEKGSPNIAFLAIGGGLVFGILMMTIGNRLLARIVVKEKQEITSAQFGVVAVALLISAWFTDYIGIYAVFGAFIAGAAMPRGPLADQVREKIHTLVTVILLPVFFVYSGLNTKLSLVNTPTLWLITLAICLIAIAGKGVACTLAARAGGEGWREACAIGTLMNARGLMELIMLNIGLQAGIITPTLFTMMVIMAVVTTLMTSPLYRWIYGRHVVAPAGAVPIAN
jgi:Kef-type K+ transport system membrane component KefB